jgi:hypothetical protein
MAAIGACYFIRAIALTPDGQHLDLEWKAWQHDDNRGWWEMRRVSDSLQLIQGNYYLDQWLRRHKSQLLGFWQHFGMDEAEAFLSSQRGHATQARLCEQQVLDQVSASSHNVPCLSSLGLLVFLHFCGTALKNKAMKQRAKATWGAFLHKLMVSGFCSGKLEAPVPDRWVASCDRGEAGQACVHLTSCASMACDGGLSSQQNFASLLWQLAVCGVVCAACKGYGQELLRQVAEHIDTNLGDSAYTSDPLLAQPLDQDRGRKRVIDEDFKRAVAVKVVEEGRAATGSQYLKAVGTFCARGGYNWNDQELLVHQAASWIGAAPSSLESITVALDAKRVGNPSENVEVMAAWVKSTSAEFVSWLPPQAPKHSSCMQHWLTLNPKP